MAKSIFIYQFFVTRADKELAQLKHVTDIHYFHLCPIHIVSKVFGLYCIYGVFMPFYFYLFAQKTTRIYNISYFRNQKKDFRELPIRDLDMCLCMPGTKYPKFRLRFVCMCILGGNSEVMVKRYKFKKPTYLSTSIQ